MRLSRIAAGFPIFLMALLAIVAYWLAHLLQGLAERPATLGNEPDYIVYGFNLRHFNEVGFLSDTLYGQTITHYPGEAMSELSDPIVLHRSEPSGPVYRSRAQRGFLDEKARQVTLSGQVRIIRQPPSGVATTLYTDLIRYHDKTGIAETDHPVEIVFGRSRFLAKRLRLDTRTDRLFLEDNVTGVYYSDP